MADTHYTAVVEVQKVTNTAEARDRYNNLTTHASRDVSEVARVVVRADSLEALVTKVKSHADLIVE
jgi:hypothetical protein